MSNIVYNTITFDPKDVDRVRELMVSPENEFDFNSVIPMPESLDIVSGSATTDAFDLLAGKPVDEKHYPDTGDEPDASVFYGGKHSPQTLPELRVFARLIEANKKLYGCSDWYAWRNRYWDTKWNACSVEWGPNTVYFETAWDTPTPVFEALSRKLGIRFEATAEEETLAFCSVIEFDNGEIVSRIEASGIEGLALLGLSREEIIDRYEAYCDDEEMEDLNAALDAIFA